MDSHYLKHRVDPFYDEFYAFNYFGCFFTLTLLLSLFYPVSSLARVISTVDLDFILTLINQSLRVLSGYLKLTTVLMNEVLIVHKFF